MNPRLNWPSTWAVRIEGAEIVVVLIQLAQVGWPERRTVSGSIPETGPALGWEGQMGQRGSGGLEVQQELGDVKAVRTLRACSARRPAS